MKNGIFIYLFSLFPLFCFSQYIPSTTGTCNYFISAPATISDPGGSGNYSNNNNVIIHLYADVTGQKVKLDFTQFSLSLGDYLNIYDGPSENSPLITQFNNIFIPDEFYSTDVSGALTLKFVTNSSGASTGFLANVSLVGTYPLGDLQPYLNPISTPAPQGGTISLTGNTKNYGVGPALSDITTFFVSSDTILDFWDPVVYIKDNLYALQGGLQRNYTFFNLPPSLLPGNYYVFAYADYNNNTPETDETNNIHFRPFQITTANAEIEFSSFSSQPVTLVTGNSLGISFTVKNNGFSSSGEFKVECLFSEDTIRDAGDFLYYSGNLTLNPGATQLLTPPYYFSDTVSPGTYYVLVELDGNDSVSETNETNNFRYRQINVTEPDVDFGFQNMICPTSFVAGAPLLVNTRVTQSGNSTSQTSSLGLYLSTDSIFSNDDSFLNSATISSINSGSFVQFNNYAFETYFSYPAGNYFLIFHADHTDNNPETNETNNFYACPVQVIAPIIDISIDSAYFDNDTIYTDGSEILHLKTTTTGNYNGSCYLRVYQSTDTSLQSSGTMVASFPITFSSGVTTTTNITLNTSPNVNEKYFHVKINPLHTLQESDFSNNDTVFFHPFELRRKDLAITQFSVDEDTVYKSGLINFNYIIYNSGTEVITNSTYYMEFSTDPIPDISDDNLSNNFYGTLNPGDSIVVNNYDIVSSTTSDGWYYILLYQEDFQDEFNPNNNVAYDSIYFINQTEFNYTLSQLNVITPVYYEGGSFQAQITAGSNDNSALMSGGVRYYLSTDTVYSMSDVALNNYTLNFTPPSMFVSPTHILQLPTGYSGNYYLLAFIDYSSSFTETNETDNIKWYPVTILPFNADFDPGTLSISSSVNQGAFATSSIYVYNNGFSSTGSSYVHYFLSADNVWDAADILLDSTSVAAMGGQDYEYLSDPVYFSSSITPGSYFVIAYADYRNVYAEADETNNTSVDNINVTLSQSDLHFTNYTFSENLIITGNSYTLYTTIKNSGTAYAPSSNVKVYISTDSLFDGSDVLLGSVTGALLSQGSTSPGNISFSAPALPDGNYFLIAFADPDNVISESSETNNFLTLPVALEQKQVDLDIISFSAPDTLINNNNGISIGVPVYLGGNSSVINFYTQCYLSADTVLDGGDLQVGSYYQNTTFSLFTTTVQPVSVSIPTSVISGSYYLLFSTDNTFLISETDENNNSFYESCYIVNMIKDVRPVLINYPDTLVPSQNYTPVNCSFKNEGNTLLTSVNYTLRISTDTINDLSDFQVINTSTGNINPGTTVNSSNVNISIGGVPTFGNYYYILQADNNNSITESDETNNEIWKPVIIDTARYDIIAVDMGISSQSIYQYDRGTYTFYTTFINNGNKNITSVSNSLFISSDTIFDGSDIWVGGANSVTSTGINQPGTVTFSVNFSSVPANAANLYLLYIADANNNFSETNENNNFKWNPIEFNPVSAQLGWYQPFTSVTFDSPLAITSGAANSISETLINHGELSSAACQVNYYLSSDCFLDANDTLIHQGSLASLSPGFNMAYSSSFNVPSYFIPGTFYYLVIEIDPQMVNASDDHIDNITLVPVVIISVDQDLYITNLSCGQTNYSQWGSGYTANNSGSMTVPSAEFTIYVSSDTILDIADFPVESNIISNFNPGYSNEYFYFNNFGLDTLAGNYYLIAVADRFQNVVETYEGNNTVMSIFNCYTNSSAAMPINDNITIDDACDMIIYDDGGKYGNYGPDNNSILTLWSYTPEYKYEITVDSINFDNCCDTLFIYDGSNIYSPVLAYFVNGAALPATFNSSGMSVTFRFSSNSNNQGQGFKLFASCIFAPDDPDLVIPVCSVSSDTLYEGASYQFSFDVVNNGFVSSNPIDVSVVLVSSTFQGNNILLGTSSVNVLLPSQSQSINLNLTIPVTVNGVYDNVVFQADYLGEVAEIYETNNSCSVNVVVDTTMNSIEEIAGEMPSVLIKPNPSNGQFIITSEKSIHSILIFDSQGRLISSCVNSDIRKELVIENNGVYLLKILFENGIEIKEKIIVSK